MMKPTRLHVAADFSLPFHALEDVVAILGRRGRGKTTTATVLVEELHHAGARFCVADPTGVWHGIKSSRDGKKPGIPCVVMGGEHGDVPLAAESGEVIADFVADPTSPSCVLDLKHFTQGELVRFMGAFLARLYHKNRAPLHLVLDEADQFAPQRPMPGEQAMLGACQRVTKMGRAKGLHPVLITQRPATLSKNVLTQAGLLIAHAITGPQDRKAVDEWIKANADEHERDTFLAELASLPRGTAYFWSPDLAVFRQVAVRDRQTFDSSATPKQGESRAEPKALAEVDLDALRVKIAATIERAKADDPKELRRHIAELRRQIGQTPTAPATVEVSVLTAEDRALLAGITGGIDELRGDLERLTERAATALEPFRHRFGELATRLRSAPAPAPAKLPPPKPAPRPAQSSAPSGDLDGVAQRILNTVAMLAVRGLEPDRDRVARWMTLHPTGGRYGTCLARLRTEGYLDGWTLTDRGAKAAVAIETGVAGAMEAIDDGSWRTMLTTIIGHGPFPSRDALADALGLHPTGGRFGTGLGRLRLLGVISERGPIATTEALFR